MENALSRPTIESHVAVQRPTDTRLTLAVSSGGHNSRIGNMLTLYPEMRLLAEQTNRTLVFPFAEQIINQIFEFTDGTSNRYTVNDQILLSYVVRNYEERLEQQNTPPVAQHEIGKPHKFTDRAFGYDVYFSQGAAKWREFFSKELPNNKRNIVVKEPIPHRITDIPVIDLVDLTRAYMKPRADLFDCARSLRAQECQPGILDICLHIRQGDFRRWREGAMFYDGPLVGRLISSIGSIAEELDFNFHLTILSDETLPSLQTSFPYKFQSSSVMADFARMAVADIVLSNSSTFSQAAAAVGATHLSGQTRYRSLGSRAEAESGLLKFNWRKAVSEIRMDSKVRKPSQA